MKLFMVIAGVGVIGQAATDGGADTSGGLPPWAQIVLAIALFVSVALKQLVPGWIYNDLRKEVDELKAENKRLVDMNLDTQKATAPALAAATRAIEEVTISLRVRERGG